MNGRELRAGYFKYIPGSPCTIHSLPPHHGVTSGQTLLRPTPHDENISTLGPPQSDEKDVCIIKIWDWRACSSCDSYPNLAFFGAGDLSLLFKHAEGADKT
jgi:hypothetical protein